MTTSNPDRFRILVCVDGSEQSERALRYAVRIGSGTDADLMVLYVRPTDHTLGSAGFDLSVVRESLLDWGIELPGTEVLRSARALLLEVGFIAEDWRRAQSSTPALDDPVGDHAEDYIGPDGRRVRFELLVSPSVARGVLDQCEIDVPDIVILSASDSVDPARAQIDRSVAETVAIEYRGTVLVARDLEESHGHLVCVWNNPQSLRAARRDAEIAGRCACPVHLFAVARDESERAEAEAAIENAEREIEAVGVRVSSKAVAVGDPVERIVEEGLRYSVIVMSSRSAAGLRRFFTSGVSFQVLRAAKNSVMIAR